MTRRQSALLRPKARSPRLSPFAAATALACASTSGSNNASTRSPTVFLPFLLLSVVYWFSPFLFVLHECHIPPVCALVFQLVPLRLGRISYTRKIGRGCLAWRGQCLPHSSSVSAFLLLSRPPTYDEVTVLFALGVRSGSVWLQSDPPKGCRCLY